MSKKLTLKFPERMIKVIYANKSQLEELVKTNPYITEYRDADCPNSFFEELNMDEQSEWVNDLKKRIESNLEDNEKVTTCVLDTGINFNHPLLKDFMESSDSHVYNDAWTKQDLDGHGTAMGGVVLFDNLRKKLETDENYEITHGLESIKILPDTGVNEADLYGSITQQAVQQVEIDKPNRRRNYCMAITASQCDGTPSSWSAAIDQLAFGDELENYDNKRLIIVSVGNINTLQQGYCYFETNLLSSVENPAQSWNCLSVGAFTNIVRHDTNTIAPPGGLTPSSRTSTLWDRKKPIKPEVVFEGGNYADVGGCFSHFDLQYLTLNNNIQSKLFSSLGDTSLATALASSFADDLMYEYPTYWPETIRGLIVHSSKWTDKMYDQLNINKKKASKGDYSKLLKVFGYGAPQKEKAIFSQENSVNLVIQDHIQPFTKIGSKQPSTNDMIYYKLPWPKDSLEYLSDKEVEIKITLSYFIEPAPGNVGWENRYRYPSNMLRFEIKNEFESDQQFLARITATEKKDDANLENDNSARWLLGVNNRNRGSIHSDTWKGLAFDLAQADTIAVYPGTGWWKERGYLKKYNSNIRFSLIISISTKENIDLYSEVKIKLENTIQTKVQSEIEIPIEI